MSVYWKNTKNDQFALEKIKYIHDADFYQETLYFAYGNHEAWLLRKDWFGRWRAWHSTDFSARDMWGTRAFEKAIFHPTTNKKVRFLGLHRDRAVLESRMPSYEELVVLSKMKAFDQHEIDQVEIEKSKIKKVD